MPTSECLRGLWRHAATRHQSAAVVARRPFSVIPWIRVERANWVYERSSGLITTRTACANKPSRCRRLVLAEAHRIRNLCFQCKQDAVQPVPVSRGRPEDSRSKGCKTCCPHRCLTFAFASPSASNRSDTISLAIRGRDLTSRDDHRDGGRAANGTSALLP